MFEGGSLGLAMGDDRVDLGVLVRFAVRFLERQSLARGMGSRHCYRRILQELERIEGPLHSLDALGSIRWVGDKAIRRIQGVIDRKIVKEIRTEDDVERYLCAMSPEACDAARKKVGGGEKQGDVDGGSEKGRGPGGRRRKYIPGYRTGGYGIMKALWMKEGITKHEIAHIGRHYCDTEFDFSCRHSAWSSMRVLVQKGLVYREGRSRFYLTDEGRELAGTMFANTSIVEEEGGDVVLVVDAREVKSRRSRQFFQEYLECRGIRHETRVLEVGDFLWIKDERICGSIVERKRGSDFVSSIVDGRFAEQKSRLLGSGIERVFYIVEGLRSSHAQGVGFEAVMSCLTATKIEGFTVIETRDISQTGSVIQMIDRQVRRRYGEGKGVEAAEETEDKDSDVSEEWDAEPGMSYGSFIEKSSKGEGRSVLDLLYMSLVSIRGLGHAKACALASRYKSIRGLVEELEAHGAEGLCEVQASGRKVSRKNASDIQEFFLGSVD